MTEYRVRITNLEEQVGREPGKSKYVIIGTNPDGVTLCAATLDDFPTKFNDQMRQEGKQLNVIQSIEQDLADPTFVICKIDEVWIPVGENGEFDVSEGEKSEIKCLKNIQGAEGEMPT
jgi:hypothetical protein